jgi:hypothetical protein
MKVTKGYYGWEASSFFKIGDGPRFLKVYTGKRSSGGVVCSAQAVTLTDGGYQFEMFGDFNVTLKGNLGAKCTEKAVVALQTECEADLGPVMEKAKAFYAAKAAKQVA